MSEWKSTASHPYGSGWKSYRYERDDGLFQLAIFRIHDAPGDLANYWFHSVGMPKGCTAGPFETPEQAQQSAEAYCEKAIHTILASWPK